MELIYHISREGQAFGPYGLSDLQGFYKSGQLVDADLVWAEHLSEWMALVLLPERVAVASADAPPTSFAAPPPPSYAAPETGRPQTVIASAPADIAIDKLGPVRATSAPTDRNLAVLVHVLGIFFSWVAPLIIYLIKKDDADTFAANNAREALNFQITLCILYIVCLILTFVLIGIFLIWIVIISNLVFSIIAAVKASNGVAYKYPFTLRLVG